MKQKSQILTIATMAVLAATMLASSSHVVYATKSLGEDPSLNRVGPKTYGSVTSAIVCGDHLCTSGPSESLMVQLSSSKVSKTIFAPIVDKVRVHPYSQSPDFYLALVKITTGDKNITKSVLHVKSDMEQMSIPVGSMFAYSSDIIDVRIHASNPSAIDAYF